MSPTHHAVVYKNKVGNGSPAEFTLLAPANMAKTTTAETFAWEPSTNPDDDLITYTLVIATDADFNTVIYQNAGIRKSEYALEDDAVLEANTTYYWKVEAVDYFGARTESGEVFVLSTE